MSQEPTRGTKVKLISDICDDANLFRMLDCPVVVMIPYQASTVNLTKLYRLNISMIGLSLLLLKR